MAQQEWTCIFQMKTSVLPQGHVWRLEFDENIVPDAPYQGWKQYIRNTMARFRCSSCRRTWPSNRVMVVFHMRLLSGRGTVKVRRFRQNCKICTAGPMETPEVASEDIGILMDNLVEKIRIKCYNENLGERHRPPRSVDVNSPHEPAHCEACQRGICARSTNTFAFRSPFFF